MSSDIFSGTKNPLTLYEPELLQQLSRIALIQWDQRLIMSTLVKPPPQWAQTFGFSGTTTATRTIFPISQASGKFRVVTGDPVFEGMQEDCIPMEAVEHQLGHAVKMIDVMQGTLAYLNWTNIPTVHNVAEQHLVLDLIGELLNNGENINCWDGKKFFAENHPANKAKPRLGTYSNFQPTATDPNSVGSIIKEISAMRNVKDLNGKPIEIEPDTVLLPIAQYDLVWSMLQMSLLGSRVGEVTPGGGSFTMSNPLLAHGLRVVKCNQLDGLDWYLLDSNLCKSSPPWIQLKYNAGVLERRFHDTNSPMFLKDGMIGVDVHLWYATSLAHPFAIRKIKGKMSS